MDGMYTMFLEFKTLFLNRMVCQNEYAQNARNSCLTAKDLDHGSVKPVENRSNQFFFISMNSMHTNSMFDNSGYFVIPS